MSLGRLLPDGMRESAVSRLASLAGRARSDADGFLQRVAAAAESPGTAASVLGLRATKARWLAADGRFGELGGALVLPFLGRNPYYEHATRGAPRYVPRRVHGFRMYLDTEDPGICRTLFSYGTHEHRSTSVFREELRSLARDVAGDVTVLDVGANVGYFCLLEATVLGDRADVHAVEPVAENLALLERNVALNGYGDAIDVERCAFGATTATAAIRTAERSNHHTVGVPAETATDEGANAATGTDADLVPQTTGERYLADRDIPPEAVDVVRMDLEGTEVAVFEGMERVFRASTPLLLHLEFHPHLMDPSDARWMTSLLDESGFDLVSAVSETGYGMSGEPGWYGKRLDVETFDDLLSVDHHVEVVARR